MENDNDPKAQELFTNLKEALASHRTHILTTYNAYEQLRFDETALRNKQAQINSQGRKDLNVIRGAEGLKNNPQAVQNISNRMDNAKKDWEIKQNLLLKLESRTTSVIQKSANAERELKDYLRDRDVKGAFKKGEK